MTEMNALEKSLHDNRPNLTPKQRAKFLREARALRANLELRKKQMDEKAKKCTHSK